MKARINTHAFRQICLESDALGVLASIAHPLAEAGKYRGVVRQDGIEVAAFRASVEVDATKQQADVDLARLADTRRRLSSRVEEPLYRVKPGGWLVLFVSEGPGGFSVLVDRVEEEGGSSFDSRELGEGDVFIATLIRPGRYRLRERDGRYEGSLTVTYPAPGEKPYQPQPPVTVKVTSKGFDPSELSVSPTQGVVFAVQTSSAAIKIDCVEPDDGPRKAREDKESAKFRWTNPTHSRRQERRKAAD